MKANFLRFVIVFVVGLLITGVWFILQKETTVQISEFNENTESQLKGRLPQAVNSSLIIEQNVFLNVPFTSQAPFANWDDVVFQNACEEASILMAMSWVEGTSLTKENAQKEISAIANFQQVRYGHFHDRSAADTAELIRDYFGYQNIEFRPDINTDDIKAELIRGNIVIVPVNGQKLNNPFFVFPGPLEHMLVIIGYDPETKEFITHDPGTSRGERFRYPEDVLGLALRDYPTGFHEPIIEINKVMIVVRPRL